MTRQKIDKIAVLQAKTSLGTEDLNGGKISVDEKNELEGLIQEAFVSSKKLDFHRGDDSF